jgi:hypothetical protein
VLSRATRFGEGYYTRQVAVIPEARWSAAQLRNPTTTVALQSSAVCDILLGKHQTCSGTNPAMLNTIVAHRVAIGYALGAIAATATVVLFERYLGLGWYISIPVAVLAYISAPILLTRFLDTLLARNARQ